MYTDPHEDGDNILGYRGYRGYPGISSGYCKCILGYLLLCTSLYDRQDYQLLFILVPACTIVRQYDMSSGKNNP